MYVGRQLVNIDNEYPFKNFKFEDKLSEGANGITYKVKHTILEQTFVIKIAKTDSENNILEAKKNSSF